MARLPRYLLPGQPQHVMQRGNNRGVIFADPTDFERFRNELTAACSRHGCWIHAYVLMTNHVHLLMTPTTASGISHVMQCAGRRYVGYFNRTYSRTGTLWEGRYKAIAIDSERYLFTLYRYIEQNPVRAGMVRDAAEYPWSSYAANALGRSDRLVSPHEQYEQLGPDAPTRAAAYRGLCGAPLDRVTLQDIRGASASGWALGDERFRDEITKLARRRAGPLPSGRPRKLVSDPN